MARRAPASRMSPTCARDVVHLRAGGSRSREDDHMPLPSLTGLVQRDFTLQLELQPNMRNEPSNLVSTGIGCDLVRGNGTAQLVRNDQGPGIWIPYAAERATYAYWGGHQWAASGPFNG